MGIEHGIAATRIHHHGEMSTGWVYQPDAVLLAGPTAIGVVFSRRQVGRINTVFGVEHRHGNVRDALDGIWMIMCQPSLKLLPVQVVAGSQSFEPMRKEPCCS